VALVVVRGQGVGDRLLALVGEGIKRYEPPVLPADIKADLENYL
jgi:hypothetical protein